MFTLHQDPVPLSYGLQSEIGPGPPLKSSIKKMYKRGCSNVTKSPKRRGGGPAKVLQLITIYKGRVGE